MGSIIDKKNKELSCTVSGHSRGELSAAYKRGREEALKEAATWADKESRLCVGEDQTLRKVYDRVASVLSEMDGK